MSTNSHIEWTEATWNPVAGCTPVSPGCLHCYAATMSYRLQEMGQAKYQGLTVLTNGVRTFNGKISFDEKALMIPLKRKKPTTYFVNSMSDLFHESVPFEFIDKVFAVMALCPQHTFQILTKRAGRMEEYLNEPAGTGPQMESLTRRRSVVLEIHKTSLKEGAPQLYRDLSAKVHYGERWPLPNVWLGVSVENQKEKRRIDELRKVPAAVRFLSLEPLLEDLGELDLTGIGWVIAGGESGGGARPCNVEWVRSIVRQCKTAGVKCFVKQLGKWIEDGRRGTTEKTKEFCVQRFLLDNGSTWIPPLFRSDYCPEAYDQRPRNAIAFGVSDVKGGEMSEWPPDLRVREMPEPAHAH